MIEPSLPVAARGAKPRLTSSCEGFRRRRDLGLRLLHAIVVACATAAAWGLGVALSGEWLESEHFAAVFCVLIAAKTLTAELFRLHRASWRWFGLTDAAAVTVANTSGSVLGALVLGPRVATPALAAILVIEWLVSQGLLLGSRLLFRSLREARGNAPTRTRKRVLIYGAGRRGVNLLRKIRANPRSVYELAGFLDDDPAKRHTMIQMNPVLGNGDELPRLARLHEIDEILVAVGPQDRESRSRFRDLARMAGMRCRFPGRPATALDRRQPAVGPRKQRAGP